MSHAPFLQDLTPTPNQQMLIDAAVAAVHQIAPAYWDKGRKAGKSTTRAMIAQAILDAEPNPLYTVAPIVNRPTEEQS